MSPACGVSSGSGCESREMLERSGMQDSITKAHWCRACSPVWSARISTAEVMLLSWLWPGSIHLRGPPILAFGISPAGDEEVASERRVCSRDIKFGGEDKDVGIWGRRVGGRGGCLKMLMKRELRELNAALPERIPSELMLLCFSVPRYVLVL